MKLPDIPDWFSAGTNLAAILVIVSIMVSTSDAVTFITGTFFVVLNSITFMYFLSRMHSRTSDVTEADA